MFIFFSLQCKYSACWPLIVNRSRFLIALRLVILLPSSSRVSYPWLLAPNNLRICSRSLSSISGQLGAFKPPVSHLLTMIALDQPSWPCLKTLLQILLLLLLGLLEFPRIRLLCCMPSTISIGSHIGMVVFFPQTLNPLGSCHLPF